MHFIPIKSLSLNQAYRGKRYATQELVSFKRNVSYILPHIEVPKGRLSINYIFGLSSKGADGDNQIKTFQDCLAQKYGFNDNRIYHWEGTKVDVAKGKEYIAFEISPFGE